MPQGKRADLSPPIGYPGGPCQVMERIRDDVANPLFQESMVETVEDGYDLTNSDASKIYDLLKEPGVPGVLIKNILFSAHAQYRMDLRQITVPEVRASLANFVKAWHREKSIHSPQAVMWESAVSWGESIRWEDPKLGLTLAFILEGGAARIVTAFWTRSAKPPRVDESSCSYDQPLPAESLGKTALKSGPTPGVQTFVTDKSQENLPTDLDREKETNLPPGSATPGSGGRDIPRVEYNSPDSGSNISERPRTLGVPGEEYGVPYKEDYNMPTRRTMTASDCESEHSWGWVSPEGDFIEVSDHGEWAITHLSEGQKAKIRVNPEVLEFWGEQGFIYPELLEASFEDGLEGPVRGLTKTFLNFLTPLVALAALGLPTLKKGWWDPRKDRLTREEEDFLAEASDKFGKAFEIRETEKSSKDNARKKALWEKPYGLWRILRDECKTLLKEEGWLMVSHAGYISWGKRPTQKQFDRFFSEVLKCWKSKGIRPRPEKETLTYFDGSFHDIPYDDALDKFASRDLNEAFFEYFLAGPFGKTLTQRRKEEEAAANAMYQAMEKVLPGRMPPPNPQRKFPPKPQEKRLPYKRRKASEVSGVGPDDEFVGDPWELANSAGIHISRGKDFSSGFVNDDGELVAALFEEAGRRSYSFDIAVLPEWQSKGLGVKLLNIALANFGEAQEAYGEDYALELDVVSPVMEGILRRRGFIETGREGGHVIMTRVASPLRVASEYSARLS